MQTTLTVSACVLALAIANERAIDACERAGDVRGCLQEKVTWRLE
jgi:hypothetical protein